MLRLIKTLLRFHERFSEWNKTSVFENLTRNVRFSYTRKKRIQEINHCGNPIMNYVKRSVSQNSAAILCLGNDVVQQHRGKPKKVLRKTKSLGSDPTNSSSSSTGFWNWQLETGLWRELKINCPIRTQKKTTMNSPTNRSRRVDITINGTTSSSSSVSFNDGKVRFI